MSEQRKVEKAMNKGLVDVVAKLLGEPPKHMYDYGMQPEWKIRAYQWVADQRRPEAVYPVHLWSAGYGGPQSPMTWFRCKTCGQPELGGPDKMPERDCFHCMMHRVEFTGWEVADSDTAFVETAKAAEGMPVHSLAKVLDGPR